MLNLAALLVFIYFRNSSVSSMINSLAAVTWQDFVRLCVSRALRGKPISDTFATVANKLIGKGRLHKQNFTQLQLSEII